jgi:DNA (cytosine-5)-methyltransferase 1
MVSQSLNFIDLKLNTNRFCQIFYFFEEKGQKLFHGQWLVHGSKTILQEAAHSRSLYLINSCASNPVASIFKKCEVKMLEGDEKEPHDDQNPRAENYHCGQVTYFSAII